jgi:hypothetical protein
LGGSVLEMNIKTSTRQPKGLDRVCSTVRVGHYGYSTGKTYVHWIRKFVFSRGLRHPDEMGEKEITNFLSHLAVKGNVSSSNWNQALCVQGGAASRNRGEEGSA